MGLEILRTNRVAGRPGLNGGSFPMQRLASDDSLILPNTTAVTAGESLSKVSGLSRQYIPAGNLPIMPNSTATGGVQTPENPKFFGTLNLLFGNKKQSLSDIKLDNKVSLFKQNKYSKPTTDLFGVNSSNRNYFEELKNLQQQFFGK